MEIRLGPFWDYKVVGLWDENTLTIDGDEYQATFKQILTAAKCVTGSKVWMHPVK